jgi:hypothetical protein
MKTTATTLLVLCLTRAAEAAPDEGAVRPVEVRLGVQVVGMPFGWIEVRGGDVGQGKTPSPTLGIRPTADLHFGGGVVFGVAPQLILNVGDPARPGSGAGYITNLLLRLGGSTRSEGPVDFYGHASAGLAWLVRPGYETSPGIAYGAHFGVRGKLGPRSFWALEGGIQRHVNDLAFTYLQVGTGIGWRWDMPPPRPRAS